MDQRLLFSSEATVNTSLRQANETLTVYGYPTLGDLFSSDPAEVERTLGCIFTLLQQLKKDAIFRSEVGEKLQRLELEKKEMNTQYERQLEQKNRAEQEIGRLQNSIKAMENKFREEKQKMSDEKEELRKELTKYQHREAQFQHEIKKREINFNKLQEQLRRALQEKDTPMKNSLEAMQALQYAGPPLFKSGDTEFGFMISRGYEETQNKLLAENTELRNCLEALQKELIHIVSQRKNILKSIQGNVTEDEDIIKIKGEIFKMPFERVSQDVLDTFHENIRRFREMLGSTSVDSDFSGQSLSQLRQLLKEYKELIYAQEDLLNKQLIEGSRIPPQPPKAQSDFSQIEQFIKEQHMLLNKQKEDLLESKDQVERSQQEFFEQKQELERRRQYILEERARWERLIVEAEQQQES